VNWYSGFSERWCPQLGRVMGDVSPMISFLQVIAAKRGDSSAVGMHPGRCPWVVAGCPFGAWKGLAGWVSEL